MAHPGTEPTAVLFEAFMENSSDHVYFKDVEGRFIRVNQAVAGWLGLSDPAEAIGRTDVDFFSAEHAERARADELEVMRTGRPLPEAEERETWLDGRETWVATTKMPLFDRDGRVIGTFGVSRDITARRQAEERLREADRRYRALVEHLPLSSYTNAPDGRHLYASPQMECMLGYSCADWLSEPDFFITLLHPDDRERVRAEVADALDRDADFRSEFRLRTRDGRTIWVLDEAAIVRDDGGRATFRQGFLLDITERKEAEAARRESEDRFEAFMDHSPAVAWIKDEDGRLEWVNAPFERQLGVEGAWRGKLDGELWPPEIAEELRRNDLAVMASGEAIEVRETVPTASGDLHHWLSFKFPFTDARGRRVVGGMAVDVTQRTRAEEALQASEQRFRTIISNVPGAIYRCAANDDWTMEFISDDIELVSGYPAADFIASRARSYASVIHPDDRAKVAATTAEGIERRRPYILEYRLVHADGSVRWVHEKGQGAFDERGTLLWLDGAIFDITERKRTEEELSAVRQIELERLEHAALTDHLTALGNNRAFNEDLARELECREHSATPVSLVLLDLDGLKAVNDNLGHPAGDRLLRCFARCLSQTLRADDSAYRIGGDEFAVILADERPWGALRLVQRVQARLASAAAAGDGVTAGIAEATGRAAKDTLVRQADLALLEAKRSRRPALVYSAGLEPEAPAQDRDAEQHHLKILTTALASAVDAKDAYTRSHCETVAEMCALIGEELGLDPDRIAKLHLAGFLHDVGKIGVPDSILQKPGRLTDEEFEVMKTHSTLGCRIVSGAELDEEADWILHHHEHLDGRGYPDGLRHAEIPLESRIILVADAFEAMTSDRCYRARRPEQEALLELGRQAGTQFDPACVGALRRVVLARRRPAADQGRLAA